VAVWIKSPKDIRNEEREEASKPKSSGVGRASTAVLRWRCVLLKAKGSPGNLLWLDEKADARGIPERGADDRGTGDVNCVLWNADTNMELLPPTLPCLPPNAMLSPPMLL